MNHRERLQEALDYIESHLRDELTLEGVAQRAAFSPYYFHRMFQAVVGESVMSYIRKRRLSHAAYELITSDRRILDVALDYGFESQEAFTRSFKGTFGITPGQYRTHKPYIAFLAKRSAVHTHGGYIKGGATMEPKLVTREELLLVGLELHGLEILDSPNRDSDAQSQRISEMWGRFNARRGEIAHLSEEAASLGVCIPTGGGVGLSYMAAVPVTAVAQVPEGMVARTLPAGRYAVFTHKGAVEKMSDTFAYIYGTWMPGQKELEPRHAPDFEYYDLRFDPEHPETSEVDIYIPIK